MRTAFTTVVLVVGTALFGTMVVVAKLLGVPEGADSVYAKAKSWWALGLLKAAGVTLVVHGGEKTRAREPRVYIANHVSWFDIPALIRALPHYGFVAKRELERIPLFGAAARAAGVIYIDRDNRKAAFGAYEEAAGRIRDGHPVLVYPEGTRGDRYALRPFKKGPFVLAIRSGAPITPVVIYGTIEVNPRGHFRASPGVVHVHVLDPIETRGLTYDDRDALAARVHTAMDDALSQLYGVTPTRIGATDPDARPPAIAPLDPQPIV